MGKTITRTIKTYPVTDYVYNRDSKEEDVYIYQIVEGEKPFSFDDEPNKVLIERNIGEPVEVKYEISILDFMKHATIVSQN